VSITQKGENTSSFQLSPFWVKTNCKNHSIFAEKFEFQIIKMMMRFGFLKFTLFLSFVLTSRAVETNDNYTLAYIVIPRPEKERKRRLN